ncbi:MAG: hypothetical protein RLY86_1164 [Pseudomonadota bacterium]|jgi:hypothetical protein
MRVVVIPEDFRKDQYILKPLFQALFRHLGKPSTTVVVCIDPLLQGVTEAMKPDRLEEVFDRHAGMADLFILCVDRDGDPGRRARLAGLERRFGQGRVFLAENAWEELETWVLAGLTLPKEWAWKDVRSAVDVKERYFDRLVRDRKLAQTADGGRRALGKEAAGSIPAICRKCPDDFGHLADRLWEHCR